MLRVYTVLPHRLFGFSISLNLTHAKATTGPITDYDLQYPYSKIQVTGKQTYFGPDEMLIREVSAQIQISGCHILLLCFTECSFPLSKRTTSILQQYWNRWQFFSTRHYLLLNESDVLQRLFNHPATSHHEWWRAERKASAWEQRRVVFEVISLCSASSCDMVSAGFCVSAC